MHDFLQQSGLPNSLFSNQTFVSTAGSIAGSVPCHEINVNNIPMSGDELINSLALLNKGSAKASVEVYCTNCSNEITRDSKGVQYASGVDLPFCTKKCSNDFFGV